MVNGNTFDASLCSIKNVEMPTYIYDINEYPVVPISPEFAKDVATREFVIQSIVESGSTRMLNITYPIGTIYQNLFNQNNPGIASGPFGLNYFGTWEPCGEGRVLIGKGSATDGNAETRVFGVAGVEGGEFSHSLTGPENGPHSHKVSYVVVGGGYDDGTHHFPADYSATINTLTSEEGEGAPHNNVQPFIVVSRWVRTA